MGNDGKNAAGCEACSTGCPRNRRGAFPVGVGEEHLRAPGCTACACPGAGPAGMGIPCPANRDQATPPWGPARATAKGGLIALRTEPRGALTGRLSGRAGHEDEDAAEDEGDPHGGGQGQRFMEKEDPEAGCGEGLREAEGRGGGGGRHLEPGEGEGKGDGRGHDPEMPGPRARPRASPATPPGRSRRRAAYTARSGGTGPSTDPGAAFWASGLLNTK